MIYLSCDDRGDAIRSLARIYRVDVGLVFDVAAGDWPRFLLESNDPYQDLFDSRYVPSLMAQHLSSKPGLEIGNVAYYHRTAYDGSVDWFQEGLLASREAASVFLNKISQLVSLDAEDREIALANIKDREGGEGHCAGGPYAFDVFDDARSARQPGMDYSLPEFLVGDAWFRRYGVCYAKPILDSLRNKLKPVVVKFSGVPSDPDGYITNLWQYVFRVWKDEPMSETSHYRCTFSGAGKSVAADRIIQIIDLTSYFGCSGGHD